MANYTGTVNRIDAQALPGLPTRTQAFISNKNANPIDLFVTVYHMHLQWALELACFKGVEVEVYYDDSTNEHVLNRVIVLDRP